jgi:hypothetical protein
VNAPELRFAFETQVQVGAPLDFGETQNGHRRVVPILGGRVEGERLKGRVQPGGADWQILHPGGAATLDARYTIEADGGALIYVANRGMRHGPKEVLERMNRGEAVEPGSYYFRSTATFETSAEEYSWLTRAIILGVGERYPDKVVLRFWEVL